MRFTIPGRPVAAGEERVTARGGQVYRYPNPQAARYQAQVRASWRAANRPPWPADQALSMAITVYYSIPPSTGARERARMAGGFHLPARRPDADAVAGLITGALTGLAFSDPRQLVRLEVVKCFTPGPAQVEVELRPWGEGLPGAGEVRP